MDDMLGSFGRSRKRLCKPLRRSRLALHLESRRRYNAFARMNIRSWGWFLELQIQRRTRLAPRRSAGGGGKKGFARHRSVIPWPIVRTKWVAVRSTFPLCRPYTTISMFICSFKQVWRVFNCIPLFIPPLTILVIFKPAVLPASDFEDYHYGSFPSWASSSRSDCNYLFNGLA